ncbi:hypothetical protein ANN_03962 [Periplaneta americana]|uniref:Uncharacterized protein n=1 Tax=Periplaneta americana TaxID=6978 RepID=A0ABQ8T7B0_PERAM|nr:hypothetical protein ANN_03962 [Periplaneta americana]
MPLSPLVECLTVITSVSVVLLHSKQTGPLSLCTKETQCAMIRFLLSEGVPGAEIHQRLSTRYEGNQTTEHGMEIPRISSQPSTEKVILTHFWDSQGPILQHYLEKNSTINSARYSKMLSNELKSAIRIKC